MILIDQIFKNIFLIDSCSANVLSRGIISFAAYRNAGVLFGLPVSPGAFYFIVIFFLFAAFFLRTYKIGELRRSEAVGAVLILAGATGNIIDRIRFGYVVDFINVGNILIFNLADIFIAGGAAILLAEIFPFLNFGKSPLKKKVYILLFAILGVFAGFLAYMGIEIWSMNLVLSRVRDYSGFNWKLLFLCYRAAAVILLAGGTVLGYAQGKYWWKRIYEKK